MPSRKRRIVSDAARPKSGERGHAGGALINGFGALCLGMVLLVILNPRLFAIALAPGLSALTSPLGICAAAAVLGLALFAVTRFTRMIADGAEGVTAARNEERNHTLIVPICGVHPGALAALEHARSLGEDVRAVYVETDAQSTETVLARWSQQAAGVPLIVLDSPRSSVTEPLVAYIDALECGTNGSRVTVVLPELVTTRAWARLLPGPLELALKGALLCRDGVTITSLRTVRRPLVGVRPEQREAAGRLALR